VPLPAAEVQRIGQRLDALEFDALHSAFWDRGDIDRNAKAAVRRSVVRYIHSPKALDNQDRERAG
jgi:hypothetical protein